MTTILHLIPSLEGGGAERQLTMLTEEQRRRGWNVHVGLRRGGVHEERMRRAGVTIHQLGDLRSLHPLLVTRVRALVRRLAPDLLQTWLPQMDVVGGVVARLTSVPWVMTERASREAYRTRSATLWLRGRLAQRSGVVIANSAEGARYWIEVLGTSHPIATVPNAVDVELIRGAPARPCQPPERHSHALLFVGRLSQQKAPEIFVEAIRQLPRELDVLALILGDGPKLGELETSIAAGGLADRVELRPYEPAWWGMMKTAAAVVSPSRFEGQPNVVLEAMAAGCPLVVSDIPHHLEILDGDSASIVPLDDPAALSAAIEALLRDSDAARRRAARAAERVSVQTVERTADAYERIYARLAGRRAA